MAIGLIGIKLGMTHVYDGSGHCRSVTAIQAGPCTILNFRDSKRDGYNAIQVGFKQIDAKKLTLPVQGQFKKLGVNAFAHVKEFRLKESPVKKNNGDDKKDKKADESKASDVQKNAIDIAIGAELTVSLFQANELVDVTGVSVGRGFQGGMKRHGWSGGPKSHGSRLHRNPGSIGTSATPSRVLKGRRLPGHMGAKQTTIQNLRVIGLDEENHLIWVEGAIPGSEQDVIMIRKSVKKPGVVKKIHQDDVGPSDGTADGSAKGKKK